VVHRHSSRAQYKLIQNLQISQGYIFLRNYEKEIFIIPDDDSTVVETLNYIFLILQHFGTKLCHFTNFNMLFLAVVMDFVLLA
jgi:hypothetical protein